MSNFNRFLAVAGFFRSSGYFKLRRELENVEEVKILVGINVDEIFRKHNKALLMLAEPDKAKDLYKADFCDDIIKADYSPEAMQVFFCKISVIVAKHVCKLGEVAEFFG